jgi:uncharacterized RDD family membrane protein YckC
VTAHASWLIVQNGAVSRLPSYPSDAAEREAELGPKQPAHDYAGWGSRVGAYLLDSLLLVVPLGLLFVIVLASDPDDDSAAWTLLGGAYLATIVLPFAYFTIMHGGKRGQTVGKRAAGIRVVDSEGRSIGYGRAFGRYALTFLLGIVVVPLLLDYLWPLWDRRNQALHDKAVGSIVVRA